MSDKRRRRKASGGSMSDSDLSETEIKSTSGVRKTRIKIVQRNLSQDFKCYHSEKFFEKIRFQTKNSFKKR